MSTLTKIFIFLQLVFSIALAVVVVMAVNADKDIKDKLVAERTGRVAAEAAAADSKVRSAAEQQNYQNAQAKDKQDTDRLSAENQRMLTETASLRTSIDTKDAQLAENSANLTRVTNALNSSQERLTAREREVERMRPEFARIQQQNAELNTSNRQLQDANDLAAKTIRTLQETIASNKTPAAMGGDSRGGITATAAVGNGGVPQLSVGGTAVQVNGRITKVQEASGKTYLTLNLGTRDGVQEGTRFTIYRNNNLYLGDAVVQKPTVDQSVALVSLLAKGQTVKVDDMVISGGGL